MRYYIPIAFLFVFLMGFNSCSKEQNGVTYEGTLTYVHKRTPLNDPSATAQSDSVIYDLRFELDNGILSQKSIANDSTTCFGEFTLTGSSFSFSSDECSCWCDCSPLVDCVGNILLGEYDAQTEGNELRIYSSNEYESTNNEILNEFTYTGVFTQQ